MAGGGIMFSSCPLVCSSVRPFVYLLPNLLIRYFDKKLCCCFYLLFQQYVTSIRPTGYKAANKLID